MFWLTLSLIAVIVLIVNLIAKFILRKIFHIQKVKRKIFSYNYINEQHRKIDKWIRLITVITLIALSWLLIEDKEYLLLYIIGMLILFVLDYLVRAFMNGSTVNAQNRPY
ncbi:DUF4181 domain-containing protein [Rossellomorea oryzaecorticis]|uniref:DUF4181 domain-containing protein n=1 Tax=Rossellomorea oryzaecorticis TaxID=1396505 RepID=A0ABW8VTF6_9BACI